MIEHNPKLPSSYMDFLLAVLNLTEEKEEILRVLMKRYNRIIEKVDR